jgi:predicted acyltransferase
MESELETSQSLAVPPVSQSVRSTSIEPSASEAARILSLDAGRGFALTVSFLSDPLVPALVNVPPSAFRDLLIQQLTHSRWDGVTLYDLGWPSYLFVTGISMDIAFSKRLQRGQSRVSVFLGLLRKFLLCLIFAFFLGGGFSVPLKDIYLESIFFIYGMAILIAGTARLLLGYRGLLTFIGLLVVGYSVATIWGNQFYFGTIYQSPEANLDMVAQRYFGSNAMARYVWHFPRMMIPCLSGLLIGKILQSTLPPQKQVWWLFGIGYGVVSIAWLLNTWIPINKPLWTTSYALFAVGIGCLIFAVVYQLIDVWHYRALGMPWIVFGVNPLIAWAAYDLMPFGSYAQRFVGYAFEPVLGVYNLVLLAVVQVVLCWLCFFALYRHQIHIRL